MATAVAGGVTYTYTYNGDGQRVKKAAASSSSYDKLYWYGLGGEVLAESDLAGTLTSEYIFMGATRIARRDVSSGNVYYFVGDRLGNARIVTNSTGGIVEESDMLPYGTERAIPHTPDSGYVANNYKFTGHERDGETNLDHTLERQLSNTLGRWQSPDSVLGRPHNPQTWNRYSYVENAPCDNVDPEGEVRTPAVVTGKPNCGTNFINAADSLGLTLNQFFNTNVGVLGLTMYFEWSGRAADDGGNKGKSWVGMGWVFVNRYNLSEEERSSLGIRGTSFQQIVSGGSTVWKGMSNDPDLKDKHQREFTKILSSGVDSSLCKGLMEAVATAHQVLWASGDTSLLVDFYRYSRTMATSFPGIDVGRLPNPSNNVGDSLFFATKDDTSTKYAMAPYRWRELIKRARFGKVHFWTLP